VQEGISVMDQVEILMCFTDNPADFVRFKKRNHMR
jgi:hypothetical protein